MVNIDLFSTIKEKLILVETKDDFKPVFKIIQRLASNERSNKDVLTLLEEGMMKAVCLEDNESLVNLYGLKILQLEHLKTNLPIISELLDEMYKIAERQEYREGLAFYYSFVWYIEKFKGKQEQSKKAILKAKDILDHTEKKNEYIYHFVRYSYAVEQWTAYQDKDCTEIFEECLLYFYNNEFYRSVIQTLGLLTIIYQQTQNKEKASSVSKLLLNHSHSFNQQPEDIKAIAYYLAGVSQLLEHNLGQADNLLSESYSLLNNKLHHSNFYPYYIIRLLSHIAIIHALQGKLEQSFEEIVKIENLFDDEHINNGMDNNSKEQVIHTLNLIKFYVYSRLFDFKAENVQILINKIYQGIENNYSDSILLSEFLLNAKLDSEQVKKLINTRNASLFRVKHIIKYALTKSSNNSEMRIRFLKSIRSNKQTIKNFTFIEKAHSDLQLAQELFSLRRYAEIAPLLKKYENRLNQIEVLELRVFMEAFIQVGAYKNGDPLGPALQYMAIKKCRLYGFSRLENTLLDYLQLQHKEITRAV